MRWPTLGFPEYAEQGRLHQERDTTESAVRQPAGHGAARPRGRRPRLTFSPRWALGRPMLWSARGRDWPTDPPPPYVRSLVEADPLAGSAVLLYGRDRYAPQPFARPLSAES